MSATKELDKSWDGAPVESYGKIGIRVVVFHKKKAGEEETEVEPVPPATEDDEPIIFGKTPIDSYLEKPGGDQCAVFLVSGQRHQGMDNTFLARELPFKYLRNRTIVIVDLDKLEQEAIGEIVQGSRQGFYNGPVYQAILDRVFATLKHDPDMLGLQHAAEQEISELESGDEAVRKKLDQLIDSHHTAALHASKGEVESGKDAAKEAAAFGKDKPQLVIVEDTPDKGEPGQEPLLISDSPLAIKLEPDVERTFTVRAQPESAWVDLELLGAKTTPEVPELTITITAGDKSAAIKLHFKTNGETDPEAYPIESTLTAVARFKGHKEPRLLLRELRVAPKKPHEKKPIILKPVPTFLRIVTRQPVRIVEGSASTHVRARWDGLDELLSGPTPTWTMDGKCTSLGSFPPITFSNPSGGVFEMLLDPPHGLIAGATLDFELVATGPAGATLKAAFKAEIVTAPPKLEARKITTNAPETVAQRRPPYVLKYIHEDQWLGNCWADEDFTADDVGCFKEPTDTQPLTLILNSDTTLLKSFRENMVARKLDENTVQKRVTNYNSHVSFHLYQMYLEQKKRMDGGAEGMKPQDLHGEINRMGATLVKIMDVASK